MNVEECSKYITVHHSLIRFHICHDLGTAVNEAHYSAVAVLCEPYGWRREENASRL